MNADVFFTIGRTHSVCQDYATVCGDDLVALSDGCSSSQHTDFGARLLCRIATTCDPVTAVRTAQPHLEAFLLPVECLDATILTAGPTKDRLDVEAFVTGDGVVVGRKRGGGYRLFLSEFPTGAPRYASYDLDPRRRARYVREFAGVHRVTVIEDGVEVSVTDTPVEDAEVQPFTTSFPVAEYDMVLLLSDGALSFHRPVGPYGATECVPLHEVVTAMLAVKGFAGEFLLRRARKFLKDAAAKGWWHDDDFAAAAIYLGELSQ
jgi:hypothetical protein